jgi:hypothetical protein
VFDHQLLIGDELFYPIIKKIIKYSPNTGWFLSTLGFSQGVEIALQDP